MNTRPDPMIDLETALAQRDEALAAAEALAARLHEQEAAQAQFYANMSHELRTPLSSIIGFTDDALDGMAGELGPEQRRYLANIQHASTHLLGVITELLDLARLQSGKAPPQPHPCALPPVVARAQAMIAPLVLKKGQHLRVDAAAGLPLAWADPDKLFQVLLNLLSNAHKFAPHGGRITVRLHAAGDRAMVSVTDDGPGIAEADLPFLFDAFTRVSKQGRTTPRGTGLGLAICQGLVRAMDGTLDVETQPGQGATFTVALPVAP